LFAEDSWRSHLIHLYSFSKAYALPGYRLGALIAQAELVTELVKVIDCMQICAPRLAQSVLTWAVDATTDWRTAQRTRINQKADAFRTAIDATGAWEVSSIGGFFAYVRHKTSSLPALTLAQTLAQTFGILTLPSEFFGPHPEPHLRMAFANLEAEEIAALPDRLPSL
jgi:aspartate/methionine/tyrosine aminotransferase